MRAADLGIDIGPIPRGRAERDHRRRRRPGRPCDDRPWRRAARRRLGPGPDRRHRRDPARRKSWDEGLFAGSHRLNGNGELTGLEWIRESGLLSSPIGLTNTHSLGVVRDALIAEEVRRRPPGEWWFGLPVVGETFDGLLNDVNGFHVAREHVFEAVAAASVGPVEEGSVGGGTGMICHGFKGGIGTSSRVVEVDGGPAVVGVLVQANHGRRPRLRVNGVPVGERIPDSEVPIPRYPGAPGSSPAPALPPPGSGSIIGIAATDAPLSAPQCRRLAQRMALGVARMGGAGENSSGDLFLAFATANRVPLRDEAAARRGSARTLGDGAINDLFYAVIDATEEAILNALLAAGTMVGRDGVTAHGLEGARLKEALEG